jgi:hypothetical protein
VFFNPTGKSVAPGDFVLSSPSCENISVFQKVELSYDLPSRPEKRGVGHRHERWGGERWTRQCPRASVIAGRVLSTRERSQGAQTNGIEADGKIVWS